MITQGHMNSDIYLPYHTLISLRIVPKHIIIFILEFA
jgi:hypothetical protein